MQNTWLKYGLIYAAISIIISLISYYFINLGLWWQMLLGLGISIIILILTTREEREKNGGYLAYGDTFKTCFMTLLVGTLISLVFNVIWIQFIDTELVEVLMEKSIDVTRGFLEKLNLSEDQIEEAMAKAEAKASNSFSWSGMLTNGLSGLIINLIISALAAIFLKKEEPKNSF